MTTNGQEPQVTQPQAGNDTQQPASQQNQGGDPTSPQVFDADYVKQLRQEAASYRTKLKAFEEEQAKANEAQLIEQNKWKELAERRAAKLAELEPTAQAYEQMLETLRASNTKRVEAIPEQSRSLVPEYSDPSKLAAWLDTNAALLSMKPIAPNINGAAGSAQRPGAAPMVLSDEELAVAKKMGLTPEQYAESKDKLKAR